MFKAENDHENNTTKYFQTPADKQYNEKPVKSFLECTHKAMDFTSDVVCREILYISYEIEVDNK